MQSVTMSRSRHQQQAQPQQGSNPANEVMEVVTINNVPVENAPHHSYRQPEPTEEAYSAHPAHSAHSADGLSDAFQQLKLKPKEFVCEFYDIELVSRNGIVLQYINTNSPYERHPPTCRRYASDPFTSDAMLNRMPGEIDPGGLLNLLFVGHRLRTWSTSSSVGKVRSAVILRGLRQPDCPHVAIEV